MNTFDFKTRQQLSLSLYQADYNLLTAQQQEMVDYDYRMQG